MIQKLLAGIHKAPLAAAFVEEGMAVANTRGYGLKTTVALNPEGASGFPQIGAGEGITFFGASD